MAEARNSFQTLAAEAAKRLDQARQNSEQLSFLADEAGRTPDEVGTGKPGRPKGALGKGSSQLREWLAARGYRMPEDVLAEMAGLASGETAMLTAMREADELLTWAFADAKDSDGGRPAPTPLQRLSMFSQLYAMKLRAAEALLPYGTPKASPDVSVQQNVQIVMPSQPSRQDPGRSARDVTPKPARIAGRMMPADVAHEIKQNQQVSEDESE
ncbi:hypothetical protein [Seohaeicola zhoushanensis]|uniref:Uncharacterized protein n=1 Tax=Seohaeicola zhoushanensis TaxID=1569283 RepID=A0A8J3GT10_9RHOB|nr:hypothetical protein [Seohaeicola zhoushanensis]GHF33196.1 hypothetical protein GCM10017056_00760 [Seohaeicola zhoushanensis]